MLAQALRRKTTIPDGSADDPSLCWLWQGAPLSTGYGRLSVAGRVLLAHRASYEAAYGPIPPGMVVRHSCDVRLCVRPGHLWLGSQTDNVRDAVAKGRNARGSRHWAAKLSEAQVLEIRASHAAGSAKSELAALFGVRPDAIRDIVTRRTWTHV